MHVESPVIVNQLPSSLRKNLSRNPGGGEGHGIIIIIIIIIIISYRPLNVFYHTGISDQFFG